MTIFSCRPAQLAGSRAEGYCYCTSLASGPAASSVPTRFCRSGGADSRANLSNHLTCLRECGLVIATAEGRHVRYDLADQRLAEGLRILAGLSLPGACS